jgi:hypothetical protein
MKKPLPDSMAFPLLLDLVTPYSISLTLFASCCLECPSSTGRAVVDSSQTISTRGHFAIQRSVNEATPASAWRDKCALNGP